jgi:hypothetical protein
MCDTPSAAAAPLVGEAPPEAHLGAPMASYVGAAQGAVGSVDPTSSSAARLCDRVAASLAAEVASVSAAAEARQAAQDAAMAALQQDLLGECGGAAEFEAARAKWEALLSYKAGGECVRQRQRTVHLVSPCQLQHPPRPPPPTTPPPQPLQGLCRRS